MLSLVVRISKLTLGDTLEMALILNITLRNSLEIALILNAPKLIILRQLVTIFKFTDFLQEFGERILLCGQIFLYRRNLRIKN
jgi:hypothetical protein